jgi:hypothetical protein
MPTINGTALGTLNDESHSSLSAYHIQPKEHIRLLLAPGRFFSWNSDWQLEIVAENHTIHLFRDIAKDYGSRHTGTKSVGVTKMLKKRIIKER